MSSTLQKKTYTVILTKDRESSGYTGRCEELHANSQGESYGEVVENMKEAVELAAKELENIHDFNLLIVQK